MNLLHETLLTVSGVGKTTLPGLFAALAQGRVSGFPSLRPHQRPAWHMFLVQLGALAVFRGGQAEVPTDSALWASLLRRLTPEHGDDAPWRIEVYDWRKPAFLQPPVPGKLKWSEVETADGLDLLITSRNHDLKSAVSRNAAAEDWLYALVSLQTCEGYGGAGNYGIARMNGGSSSRPLLGLAPVRRGELFPDPSAWWLRDVRRLLDARRAEGRQEELKPALLWCLDWPEGELLRLEDLDPWFIEVCRRIRLSVSQGRLTGLRAASRKSRIAAVRLQGNTGDPWAPVHGTDGRSLTIGTGEFDHGRLCALLFSGEWERPLLCRSGAGETGDRILVAEAISRGNIKTQGFQSRLLPIPEDMLPQIGPKTRAASLAEVQLGEVRSVDRALRYALAVMAAGGSMAEKRHFRQSLPARMRFARGVEPLFFESLWRRVRAEEEGSDAGVAAQFPFLDDLLRIAGLELEAAFQGIPCPAVLRSRAEARARRWFHNSLWGEFPEYFARAAAGREMADETGTEERTAIAEAARNAEGMLRNLAPGPLARARRMSVPADSPIFSALAARHPRTVGRHDRRMEWTAVIRTLAILEKGLGDGSSAAVQTGGRRLGAALCDGGNPQAWRAGAGRIPLPVFSERRLAQLLAARGLARAVFLERAARLLSRSRASNFRVDPAEIALVLLVPEDDRLLAEPYYERLDRVRHGTARSRRREDTTSPS